MLLEIVATDTTSKTAMGTIREAKPLYTYFSIYTDDFKRAYCFFLSELLTLSLREEEENETLFHYISTNLTWLDVNDDIRNFYATFLINLTKFLGFYPNKKNIEAPFFDLREGVFCGKSNTCFIEGREVEVFKMLLSLDTESFAKLKLSKSDRQQLLHVLVTYYKLHISSIKTLHSVNVLSEVFK